MSTWDEFSKYKYDENEQIDEAINNTFAETAKPFVKHNQGKIKWRLLPIEPVEDIIRTMMHGEIKYSADNWKRCNDPEEYYDAAMRHMTKLKTEGLIDLDSKEDQLYHAACAAANMIFYQWLTVYKDNG